MSEEALSRPHQPCCLCLIHCLLSCIFCSNVDVTLNFTFSAQVATAWEVFHLANRNRDVMLISSSPLFVLLFTWSCSRIRAHMIARESDHLDSCAKNLDINRTGTNISCFVLRNPTTRRFSINGQPCSPITATSTCSKFDMYEWSALKRRDARGCKERI
jgi:hypothetical protein